MLYLCYTCVIYEKVRRLIIINCEYKIMNNNNKIGYVLIVLVIIVIGFYFLTKDKATNDTAPIVSDSSILGCYVSTRGQDVYTLEIRSDKDGAVDGVIAYNNYQYDSSSGTFTGTYVDGILLGNYSFDAEGMHSERQLIWKREGNNFIQGFGDGELIGGKEVIANMDSVTYDPGFTFQKRDNCVESFTDRNSTVTEE